MSELLDVMYDLTASMRHIKVCNCARPQNIYKTYWLRVNSRC